MKRSMPRIFLLVATVLVFLLFPVFVFAYWSQDPTRNNIVSKATADQTTPQIVSDSSGGAFIAWYDYRSGSYTGDIYAQRIDSVGNVKWAANGLAVATGAVYIGQMASDGSGGAIITWPVYRNAGDGTYDLDLYVQRIGPDGNPKWTTGGVLVSGGAGNQGSPQIIADGSGGAIITWQDDRNDPRCDIYAQRVDAEGSTKWTAGGIAVSAAPDAQGSQQATTDGGGGAIITWQDLRNTAYGTYDFDIYAQRIDANGNAKWMPDGVPVCTAANGQTSPQIAYDQSGGAVITWEDWRDNTHYRVYAQRVDSSGSMKWTSDGVAVSTFPGEDQVSPQIISADGGGTIIAFMGYFNFAYGIYAQKIGAGGNPKWLNEEIGEDVIAVSREEFVFMYSPRLVSDGSGGAIITWQNMAMGENANICAQRIYADGHAQWIPNGVAVSIAAGDQLYPQIVRSGGGAIITWHDSRNGNFDIYAQKVFSDGMRYKLKASAYGTGSGTVTSSGGGLNFAYPAADTGSATVNSGGSITLTATAAAGSTARWFGSCDSTGGTAGAATCTIKSMDKAREATVAFWSTGLAVLSPNGGEILASGSSYDINWSSYGTTEEFMIYYSVDNGTSWLAVTSGKVYGNKYSWNVPVMNGNKGFCRIKVVGYDNYYYNEQVASDRSDAAFSIEVVRVASPNGGEELTSGISYDITWSTNSTTTGVVNTVVQYSLDGNTWVTAGKTKGNPGFFVWSPVVTETKTQCQVKIILKDAAGNVLGSDRSDGFFTVKPASP